MSEKKREPVHSYAAHRRPTTRRELVVWFGVVTLGVLLLCATVIWLPQLVTNLRLRWFANHLYDHPLPPQTEVVSRRTHLEHVAGGNGCWYIVNQRMNSSLSRAEVEAHYRDVVLPAASGGLYRAPAVPIRVDFDQTLAEGEEVSFALSLADVGPEVSFDLRCH